jgi:predicted dehydrogenase
MKRIGFVDYDLDNFHSNTYLRLIRADLKLRAFEISCCTALRRASGRNWAKRNGIPWCDRPDQMAGHADVFAIMAPSNAETHLELCRAVFPLGKRTFVDKTFAPSFAEAKKIHQLARRYRVQIESSSALRYTDVQDRVWKLGGPAKLRHMVTFSPGGSFEEYAVHPLEMVMSCMGPNAKSIMRRGTGKSAQLLLEYPGGRTATVNIHCATRTPFAAALTTAKETTIVQVDRATLFLNAASAMLDFFEEKRKPVPRKETLAIMQMIDAAERPEALKRPVRLKPVT